MINHEISFNPGDGDWAGVVMIERPDASKASYGQELKCRVMSARTVQLNGSRAIYELLPYEMFAPYFQSDAGDHIFCEAEYKSDGQGGGHLEVYRKAQTNLKEWVLFSQTPEQIAAALN